VASARQSSASLAAKDADTAVAHNTLFAPKTKVAKAPRNAESAPPLKATTTFPIDSMEVRSASTFTDEGGRQMALDILLICLS
jgi:hypothetical protein